MVKTEPMILHLTYSTGISDFTTRTRDTTLYLFLYEITNISH